MLTERESTTKSKEDENRTEQAVLKSVLGPKQYSVPELNKLQELLEQVITKTKEEEPEVVKELREAGILLDTYEEPNSYPSDRNMA